MAVNMTGGFTYIDFLTDAPVIVSDDGKEFYKQPIFFALGHFSKFVTPGSVRVKTSFNGEDKGLRLVAVTRPDKTRAIVVLNQ